MRNRVTKENQGRETVYRLRLYTSSASGKPDCAGLMPTQISGESGRIGQQLRAQQHGARKLKYLNMFQ